MRSPSHPDPDAEQLSAVKKFLSSVRRISGSRAGPRPLSEEKGFIGKLKRAFRITTDEKVDESLGRVVFTHGGYQAAYFLGDYNPFSPGDKTGSGLLGLGDDVLNKVGVWYDFACMPQDPGTRDQLVSALARIHELLGASNLIALRKPGDGYESRAWCAAEVATDPDIERTRFRKICIRLDEVGNSFPATLLLDQPSYFHGIADIAIKQLQRATSGNEAARAIASFVRMVGVDSEDEREFPTFFVKRKPWIFAGQREFMVQVIRVLEDASENDARHERESGDNNSFSIRLDLAKAVTLAASAAGLKSSKQEDLPYTALLILYARHRGAPELAGLFADCLERLLSGRTTVLARYQEKRGPQRASCWYRFQDQVTDSSVAAWSRE